MNIHFLSECKEFQLVKKELEEIGILDPNYSVGTDNIKKSSLSNWINDCPMFFYSGVFEFQKIKNCENLFKSEIITRKVEIIFDNDWPEENLIEGQVGYRYYPTPNGNTIWYKKTEGGKLTALWQLECGAGHGEKLGYITKLMIQNKYCLRIINIPLPPRT